MNKFPFLVMALLGAPLFTASPRVLAAQEVAATKENAMFQDNTPEDTIAELENYAKQRYAFTRAWRYVAGTNALNPALQRASEMLADRFPETYIYARVLDKKVEGDRAVVQAEITLQDGPTGISMHQQETVTLHRNRVTVDKEVGEATGFKVGDYLIWQIEPDETVLNRWESPTVGIIERMAAYIGFPERAIENNQANVSLNNAKEVLVTLLGFSSDPFSTDADRNAPVSNATLKEKLLRYVKNEDVFTAPGGAKGSVGYRLNLALGNFFDLTRVAAPAETVALYESKNDDLDFRYDGKAVVAFADGHVALVSREEAKLLRWKP